MATSVAVVMSTYNGEAYLADQIDSVLLQRGVDVHLFVRDDGSRDGTVAILEAYAAEGLLELVRGENAGVVGSFLSALALVPDTCPFIAFCDQDDIWHSDKLSRALDMLRFRDQRIPQLYCSEYNFCDEQMGFVARSHLNRIGVAFPTMLYEDMVSGNTLVMNRALADLLVANGTEGVYTHDWWTALVATGLGELVFDDFASLDYRRLSSSVSPTGSDWLTLLRYRIRVFLQANQLADITAQLHHFEERYGSQLPADKRRLLARMTHGNRFQKAMTPVRLRQRPIDEVALRALFLFGLL